MKKLYLFIFILLGLFAFSPESNAQTTNPSFQEGDLVLNAGIGLGTTFAWGAGGLGLPLGAGLEYGVKDAIGVGGDFGFISGSGITVFFIGAKGSYHFNDIFNIEDEKWDVYGGLGLYYRAFNFSGITSSLGSGIYPAFHAGARYYLSENFGIHAELGNTVGWLRVGVAFKF